MSAVATRYARALFELAQETGQKDSLVAELERAAAAYTASAELQGALENPLVAHAAKRGILTDVADRLALSPTAKNALLLLSDRRRLRALPAIARRLRDLGDLAKGIAHAEVVSAAPLSEGFYMRLQAQLEKSSGKKLVLDRKTDPSLIAGVVVRMGDTVVDGSLRARLDALKTALTPN